MGTQSDFRVKKNLIVGDGTISSESGNLVLRRDFDDTTYNQITLGDDTYKITLDNSDRFYIDGGGQVGIGTTSPVSKAHIEKTAYDFDSSPADGDFHLMLKATESSTAGDAVSIGFSQSSDLTTVGAKISHLIENSFSRGALVFSTNNTASAGDTTEERMRITGAGNVGIGITSPGTKVHISDDAEVSLSVDSSHATGAQISLDSTGTGGDEWRIVSGADNAGIGGGAFGLYNVDTTSYRFNVTSAGNVGIGTTSPDSKLQIAAGNNPASAALMSSSSLAISSNDGNLDLLSYDDDTTVANNIAFKRFVNGTDGALIHTFGISHWVNTGSVGSNTGDRLAFNYGTNANPWSNTELLTIESGGNVGIGYTSPAISLDIRSGSQYTNTYKSHLSLVDTQTAYDGSNPGGAVIFGGIDDSSSGTSWWAKIAGEKANATDGNRSGILNFYTRKEGGNPTSQMVINEDGEVGIGTTSPDAKLHVEGSVLIDAYNNGGAGAGLFFREGFLNTNQPSITVIDHSGANPDGLCIAAHDGISFKVNGGTERVRFASDGNVGIGVTDPDKALEVNSGSTNLGGIKITGSGVNTSLTIDNTGTNGGKYRMSVTSGSHGDGTNKLIFQDNNTARITLDSAGDVGIGTSDPTAKLHVNGDIKCTGLDLQNGALEYGGGVQQSGDLAVGWYTFAVCKGRDATTSAQRAFGEFLINDVDSGRHGSCRLNATHFFGAGNSIQVFAYNFYSTAVFTQLRIKESGTYAGAALQVYVSNANNNLESYMTLSEQNQSWDLLDTWLADSDDSGHNAILGYASHSQDWSGFAAAQTVDLSIFAVSQGGIYTTGGIYGEEIELKDATGITIQTANSNARHKKIFATTSNDGSPWDEMVYYSRGSTGGWSGQHTFTVDKNGTSGTGYEALRIRDSGDGANSIVAVTHKLGVGTTSPGHLLEVAGGGSNGEIVVNRTSGAEILLQAQSATGVIGTSTNHDLAIKTNATTRMHIENGGNVGIGDTTPSYKLDVNGDIRAQDDMYTDKLIASQGIRSSSRASFNTMQMYYYDRQSMGTQAIFLRVPVGGSSTANPGSYAMPHAGQVMQVMYQFYGSTFGTGTDTWKVIRTDTNGNTAECDFTIAHSDVNQIGTGTTRNILKDISALDDSITFSAGDILQIQRTTANINLTHVNAQLWVVFDI